MTTYFVVFNNNSIIHIGTDATKACTIFNEATGNKLLESTCDMQDLSTKFDRFMAIQTQQKEIEPEVDWSYEDLVESLKPYVEIVKNALKRKK